MPNTPPAGGGAVCAAGVDYQAASGTLTFAPGETSKPVAVSVCGDSVDEPDETLTATLANPTNAVISAATATARIVDDEGTILVTLGQSQLTRNPDGTGTMTVQILLVDAAGSSGASGVPVIVTFTTADGTAKANIDYVPVSGGVTFQPGETITITVLPVRSQQREPGPPGGAHRRDERHHRLRRSPDGHHRRRQRPRSRRSGSSKDDTDKPARLPGPSSASATAPTRWAWTTDRTQGNVVEVRCDAAIPTVSIANRDGRVEVQLLEDAERVAPTSMPATTWRRAASSRPSSCSRHTRSTSRAPVTRRAWARGRQFTDPGWARHPTHGPRSPLGSSPRRPRSVYCPKALWAPPLVAV